MSRVFVIADLHFGHRLVAGKRGFAGPDEHDAALCEAWRKVVGKRDVVYVLGDVFDPSFLRILPGTKKLAMGNHDRYPVERYTPYFSKIGACFEFDGCLLTHIPVHPGQFGRYELNVHGHTHAHFVDDERYVSVSVEHCTRMEPLPLRELIQARRERLAVASRFGQQGVRDLDNVCMDFTPGTPEPGHCLGDGHYLCKECVEFRPEEDR